MSFINTIGPGPSGGRNDELARDLLMLLLGAGADPNGGHETAQIPGTEQTRTFSGLSFAIWVLSRDTRSGPRREILMALIRAGASLDCTFRDADREGTIILEENAEAFMARLEREIPNFDPHDSIGHWAACKALVADVRAAGGTWAAYARRPRKAVMRLRSLVLRGRALPKLSCDAAVVLTCRRLPNELAWHVLTFWRVADEATGTII